MVFFILQKKATMVELEVYTSFFLPLILFTTRRKIYFQNFKMITTLFPTSQLLVLYF